ncbi:MAG: beta-ketoacyl synthase N-terminal-like domain-containing protein [Isosphaeraceae bacterium]|nr:beta-ketoacyl synthase N-terminal-like domain-containing protein [Isosphaeraceae bacterium]
MPIAIVGMAAHVGPFSTLRAFQERALGGAESEAPTEPSHTWGVEASRWLGRLGTSEVLPRGFYLNQVTLPLDRFRIPPKELEEMLPQQSLMLRVAADAIREAGWDDRPRLRAGTFIGIGLDLNTTNFQLRWWVRQRAPQWSRALGLDLSGESFEDWVTALTDAAGPPLTANRTMGALGGLIASRIAREFRIGGPSFTISAEETSGTRALAVAARLLGQGELDEAVVGAVDLPGDPRAALSVLRRHESAQPDSPPLVLGEGAVAFVLKRLADAERDGDRIFAVLKGFGDGSDGHEPALDEAGSVSPVGYIETPREGFASVSATAQRFAASAVGCAEGDFGHLGAASTLVALAKGALCLYQQILPPWRGDRSTPSKPQVGIRPRAAQFWLRDRDEGPRRALVFARSLDGNAHCLVLEEHEQRTVASTTDRLQPTGARVAAVFAVETDDLASLDATLAELETTALEQAGEGIEKLARRWWTRHPNQPTRRFGVALVAESIDMVCSQVRAARSRLAKQRPLSQSGATRGLYFSPSLLPAGQVRDALGQTGSVAFVYPGIGNLHAGMGRTLSAHWPEVLRRQDAECGKLRSQLAPGSFWNEDLPTTFPEHRAPILGQVAVGAIITDVLERLGIKPAATIGYSLGETAALVALRAWTERDEMLRRVNASPLFRTELAGPCEAARRLWGLPASQRVEWLAGVVPCSPEALAEALEGRKRVYRLIVNSPAECMIGGERAAVLRLVDDLGCRLFPLPIVSTVHCEITRIVAREYRELHELATTPPPGVRFYSGAWGHAYHPDATTAANAILAQATDGIDFPRVIERAYADGVRVFVEVGPGASCVRLIDAILGNRPHLARAACLAGLDEVITVLDLAARLIAERVPVDLAALYGQESRVVGHQEPVQVVPQRVATVLVGGRPFAMPPLPRPVPTDTADAPDEDDPPFSGDPTPSPRVSVPPTKSLLPSPSIDPSSLQRGILAGATARAGAHEAYLSVSSRLAESMTNQLRFQIALVEALMTDAPASEWSHRMPRFAEPRPALDRDQCLEFAIGSIGAVLGPEFAPVDDFPTRVRLPDEPLMLVDRVVSIEGEPRSMTHGRVVTEHDILPGAWYLDGGRIPPCIAIESGQADLFLSGYLGIDFITRGLAVYRLLDAAVTFHRGLPGPGSVIRYDIYIDRFFRQGDTHLFRFRFEAEVDGEPLLSMREGCAGFFSAEELAAGKGIVAASLDRRPQRGTLPLDWEPLVALRVESYDDAQVDALRHGDLAGAFGSLFEDLPLEAPAPLPGGRMTLVDRVLALDPNGGRYGLGVIRAEADIHPGDWFMVCHFVDDRVMPGTLMYECCLHTLRIYLTRLGWVGEQEAVAWEPVPGVATKLRCRGQVTESTKKIIYEIAIKELGYGPEPFAIVDAFMVADGKPIVEFSNMSLRLAGQTREGLQRIWAGRPMEARAPLYTREQILAFATGKPSEAFGEPFRVFDEGRFIARLPAPPYSFLDRVTALAAEPLRMAAGGTVEAEYDIPPDEWYFAADQQPRMPFAVLLEIALQPCGWMAAYMGSALTTAEPLHFRNLGGRAVQVAPITPATGTLTSAIKVTRVANSAGMIIQHFDFEIRDARGTVYQGDTYFGFFRPEALANQVGIREATPYQPSAEERKRARAFAFPTEQPYPDAAWRMVETIDALILDGGPAGLGFVEGSKRVNPDDWFFKAHFHQDPVCPGSLGLESFLQLLKVVAGVRWGVGPDTVFETPRLHHEHRWVYRGQVVPSCERVSVQAVVTAIDDQRRRLTADGFLSVDGRVIYQMNAFTLEIS